MDDPCSKLISSHSSLLAVVSIPWARTPPVHISMAASNDKARVFRIKDLNRCYQKEQFPSGCRAIQKPNRYNKRWRSARQAVAGNVREGVFRGKSGLRRAACRLTAGRVRSKRALRIVPQKIYRPGRSVMGVLGKGEMVR